MLSAASWRGLQPERGAVYYHRGIRIIDPLTQRRAAMVFESLGSLPWKKPSLESS